MQLSTTYSLFWVGRTIYEEMTLKIFIKRHNRVCLVKPNIMLVLVSYLELPTHAPQQRSIMYHHNYNQYCSGSRPVNISEARVFYRYISVYLLCSLYRQYRLHILLLIRSLALSRIFLYLRWVFIIHQDCI